MKLMQLRSVLTALCVTLVSAGGVASAANLALSIGIRETGGSGPAFSDAGTGGGIEWVNRDGQSLVADGTWQQFTFTPSTDTLTAFAGTTANGILDTDWASLEHIRILNSDGTTQPIRLWIDDVTNTDSAGVAVEGFEAFAVGDEVMFQEPGFSGSTSGNVVAGGTSAVSDAMANTGSQSYEVNFQFVDDTPTRWVRLTSFGAANLQDAAVHVREANFNPTISFMAKATVIPEPGSIVLAGLAVVGLLAVRRRAA